MRRSLSLLVLCWVLLAGLVAPAWAAPPNDTFDGAITVTVPSTTTADSSGATIDAAENEVGRLCNVPPGQNLRNAVWYRFTATEAAPVLIDTAGSGYSVAGAVVTGTPGSFQQVSCFIGSTVVAAQAGTTYSIVLVDWGGGDGGPLRLALTTGERPTASMELTGATLARRTGEVELTGTITCTPGAFAGINGTLQQRLGRSWATTEGYASAHVECDGTPQPWSATVCCQRWRFRRGVATFSSVVFVSSPFGFSDHHGTATVRIKPA